MYKSLKAKLSTSQSSKTSCLVLTSNMSLQVLPLRVLVSRQVIRERMDYRDCFGGQFREGKFFIDTSELEVLWRGEKQKKSGSI